VVDPEIKRFVAVLATGFVLFTLLVQATTLKPLMRFLRIDRLTPVDALLREQALEWSHADVRRAIAATAETYALPADLAIAVAADFARDPQADIGAQRSELGDDDRVALGLASLAMREQDLILQHLEEGTVSPGLVGTLLVRSRRLLEAARLEGSPGYAREAERALGFSWRIHFSNRLHTRLGIGRLLERQLSMRFEMLLVNRIVVNRLCEFADAQLSALLGADVGAAAKGALTERLEQTRRSLDALVLQYPDYAEELSRRFLRMSALRREWHGYDRLYDEGLIGPEVRRVLIQDVDRRGRAESRPRLDLRLDTRTLIGSVPLFQGFDERQVDALAALMRPAFAIPGQQLIFRGERGEAAWFIASGAVEVETGRNRVRLGRGDFFGELALLTGRRRQADVTAIAYCELLVLTARDFRTFLDRDPEMRRKVEAVAAERINSNREAIRADGGSPA
jgi:CPA1 family monovalent cation:H+ antiporter